MKPENQVVSLELAKELKKNGYKQEGVWWWREYNSWILETGGIRYEDGWIDKEVESVIAPTVAELGEALKHPKQEILSYHPNSLPLWTGTSWVLYRNGKVVFEADTEANARAKMWLYLKKENLI